MMGYYTSYGWNSWMLILMLVWPVILAAAIWAVVVVTRDRSGKGHEDQDAPLDILKRRFANGAITQQEYRDARAILENGTSRDSQPS